MIRKLLIATAISLIATPVLATPPTLLQTFGSWSVWKGADAAGIICYVSATPSRSAPSGVNRDPISFLVIDHQGAALDEVQTLMGYPLDAGKAISASIDGREWPMAASEDAAWLQSTALEPEFVAAMKAGTSLVVKGTSRRGTNTTDTYSLSGVTKALEMADAACL